MGDAGFFRVESVGNHFGNPGGLLALEPLEVNIRALAFWPLDDNAGIAPLGKI